MEKILYNAEYAKKELNFGYYISAPAERINNFPYNSLTTKQRENDYGEIIDPEEGVIGEISYKTYMELIEQDDVLEAFLLFPGCAPWIYIWKHTEENTKYFHKYEVEIHYQNIEGPIEL
jgi:hypothetical protein